MVYPSHSQLLVKLVETYWINSPLIKIARELSNRSFLFEVFEKVVVNQLNSINQSIHQSFIAPISSAKPGSVAQQPNQCSTAESRKQLHTINRQSSMLVSMGERPSERDVSSKVSWSSQLKWLEGHTVGSCSKETEHKTKISYACDGLDRQTNTLFDLGVRNGSDAASMFRR